MAGPTEPSAAGTSRTAIDDAERRRFRRLPRAELYTSSTDTGARCPRAAATEAVAADPVLVGRIATATAGATARSQAGRSSASTTTPSSSRPDACGHGCATRLPLDQRCALAPGTVAQPPRANATPALGPGFYTVDRGTMIGSARGREMMFACTGTSAATALRAGAHDHRGARRGARPVPAEGRRRPTHLERCDASVLYLTGDTSSLSARRSPRPPPSYVTACGRRSHVHARFRAWRRRRRDNSSGDSSGRVAARLLAERSSARTSARGSSPDGRRGEIATSSPNAGVDLTRAYLEPTLAGRMSSDPAFLEAAASIRRRLAADAVCGRRR